MALTNVERQRRFRERQRSEALARIERYRAAIEASREFIRQVDAGMTFHQAIGNQQMRDVTGDLRAQQERQIEMYREFASMWEKQTERHPDGSVKG
jgi:ribosomal protein L9